MFVVLGSQCTGHVPKLLPGGLGLTSLLGVFVRYIQSAATIGQVEMPQNAPHPAIFARLMNSAPANIFVTLPDSDSNARQGGKGWAGRVLRWMGADVPLDRSKDSRACLLLHAENSLLQYIYKKAQAAWGDSRWNSWSKNSNKSCSSRCSTILRTKKDPTVWPWFSRKKPSPSKAWPKSWAWTRCAEAKESNTLGMHRGGNWHGSAYGSFVV